MSSQNAAANSEAAAGSAYSNGLGTIVAGAAKSCYRFVLVSQTRGCPSK